MIRYLNRVINRLRCNGKTADTKKKSPPKTEKRLTPSLAENLAMFHRSLGSSTDILIKEFRFGCSPGTKGALVFIDGLTDAELINNSILRPLMVDSAYRHESGSGCASDLTKISCELLSFGDTKKTESFDALLADVLAGNTALLIDGSREALSIGAKKWEKRGVSEPYTENVVRGPRQGFTETLRNNTAMLRRILRNPKLRFESVRVGEQTQTDICVVYIEGIVMDGLVEDIKKRLEGIKTDSILDSGYVQAFIEDSPYSIFPTVGYTERPDTAAGKILEGRAAILVDGSPIALTVPMVFIEDFQTSEDYYLRAYYATYLRMIRLFAYFLTTMAPALYVAVTTFHQEILPTPLLFTITAGLSGLPFPAMVEAFLMVVTFDLLREAGIRLPKPVGSAISIVGALVIGNATVSAGLVGPFMVIIIAFTAIAGFLVPKQVDSTTVLRYVMLILGGLLGGFGIILGVLFFLIHIESMQSFGVPYLSPITPTRREGMLDTFIRAPLRFMFRRPSFFASDNRERRGENAPYEDIK